MTNQQPLTLQQSIPERPSLLDFEKGQIININKPEGWSSFDVVRKIRYHIHVKKIGHAGTLDPFASGVLLICTGKATKRVQELMNYDKEYWAHIELGKTTDTYDITGKVQKQNSPPHVIIDEIKEICYRFKGEIYQIPPMFSAIKINGKRLYKLARKGLTVKRNPRKVKIFEIEVLDFENPYITLKVICSKGTYIRALANDIGEMVGCGAYLKSLIRTRIGPYDIESASSISDFTQQFKFQ